MRFIVMLALLVGATLSHAQTAAGTSSAAKKELVTKLLTLQQAGLENIARSIVERPALQLMQAAGAALQQQVPPDRREATAKAIDADVRRFVDEGFPLLRDRALKLAPSTYGASLEEKFSEDELKALVAWQESAVAKKYQQIAPEIQNAFAQKLIGEAAPLLDPKLQALQQKVRATVETASAAPAAAPAKPAASGTRAPAAPGRAASK